ncbi:MAG TPA: hypothetical protein VGF69_21635 [Thermoanaerobaculia bacterium]
MLLATFLLAASIYTPPVPKGLAGSTTIGNGPIPFPKAGQTWIGVRSESFDIVSSAGEGRTLAITRNLETLASALRQTHPRYDGVPTRTRVFFFGRRGDAQPYFDLLVDRKNASISGAFVNHHDGGGTMFIDAGRAWATRTPYHELVHNQLAQSGATLPGWLEEGLAEYFSNADVRGELIEVGRPVREHQALMRKRPLIPLKELFAAPRASNLALSSMYYAQSWGIVDWLMRSDRGAFDDFVADLENGMPSEEALQKHYRTDLETLERWLRSPRSLPSQEHRLSGASSPTAPAVTPLTQADALHELGLFLGKLEGRRADAQRHFEAALAADPRRGRSVAAIGLLRMREKKFDEAMPFFERALTISPDDAAVYLMYAESLLRDAVGTFAGTLELDAESPARFRRARELALKARELGADANAVIGISYLVEKDVTPGIAALEAADRTRNDVALHLYALLLRTGSPRAEALFRARFADTSDDQLQFAARSIYVREQLERVNRFVAAGQTHEAITLMREMIAMTPDAAAKAELERQIVTLSATDEVNRHITTYNDAITLANKGQNREAMKIVDDLLKVAHDPHVIADAKSLREELRGRLRKK